VRKLRVHSSDSGRVCISNTKPCFNNDVKYVAFLKRIEKRKCNEQILFNQTEFEKKWRNVKFEKDYLMILSNILIAEYL